MSPTECSVSSRFKNLTIPRTQNNRRRGVPGAALRSSPGSKCLTLFIQQHKTGMTPSRSLDSKSVGAEGGEVPSTTDDLGTWRRRSGRRSLLSALVVIAAPFYRRTIDNASRCRIVNILFKFLGIRRARRKPNARLAWRGEYAVAIDSPLSLDGIRSDERFVVGAI